MAGKTDKSGRAIRFLPESIADDAITDMQIDEAMSELAEAEILRTRRRHKDGTLEVPPGLVTRHIKALAAANPRVAGKFQAFFEAVRGYFGLALRRGAVLEKGFRDGSFTLAGDLKRLSAEGGLSPELETALRESLGFGAAEAGGKYDADRSSGEPARQEGGHAGAAEPTMAELAREGMASFSIGRETDSPATVRAMIEGAGGDETEFGQPELTAPDGERVEVPEELFRLFMADMDAEGSQGHGGDWAPLDGLSTQAKDIVVAEEARIVGRSEEHGAVIDLKGEVR